MLANTSDIGVTLLPQDIKVKAPFVVYPEGH